MGERATGLHLLLRCMLGRWMEDSRIMRIEHIRSWGFWFMISRSIECIFFSGIVIVNDM
ncbi:hypothetical protein I3842_16G113100 [Carya illinoinensis]|uniref:Uncharacterized protein n=1 Tax=Carya illinoinensis TaxID=32201 RepID=A0A922D6E3_CARIL|nr:hypothetical protein I3842_16G113100 [Carya illinoinensis]